MTRHPPAVVWSVAARARIPGPAAVGSTNTYVLPGPEGYFSMNLVTSMDQVELEKPTTRELLAP